MTRLPLRDTTCLLTLGVIISTYEWKGTKIQTYKIEITLNWVLRVKEIRLLLVTIVVFFFFLTASVCFRSVFMLVLLTFPSIWILASFVSCRPMSVHLGIICICIRVGLAMLINVQLPYVAVLWPLNIKSNTAVNKLSLPDSSAASIPCFCGDRWGLYGPVIPASRHHSRSTGALYAPDVYGASGEGWVHFHYHLCIHLRFCPFSFSSHNIHFKVNLCYLNLIY